MNMRISRVALMVVLSGCASVPPYVPTKVDDKAQALAYVQRCLREQPPELAPISVEVNYEFMRAMYQTSDTSWNMLSTNIIDVAQATYYESVATAELGRDEGAYVAMLFDNNGDDLILCYHHDIVVATRFIDGVMSLKP